MSAARPLTRLVLDPAGFPGAAGAVLRLSGAEHHYLTRVLRAAPGARLWLADGQGRRALARVTAIDGATVALEAEAVEEEAAPAGPRLTLYMALLKGDRQDWVLQKATELGVHRLVPVRCGRCVVQLAPAQVGPRRERWERIVRGAAQQCRRPDVPQVEAPRELAAVLAEPAGEGALRLLPYEGALRRPLRGLWPEAAPAAIEVLVGPEGGFEAAEVAAAQAAGFLACGLGPRILRAETAALAVLAALGCLLDGG